MIDEPYGLYGGRRIDESVRFFYTACRQKFPMAQGLHGISCTLISR